MRPINMSMEKLRMDFEEQVTQDSEQTKRAGQQKLSCSFLYLNLSVLFFIFLDCITNQN